MSGGDGPRDHLQDRLHDEAERLDRALGARAAQEEQHDRKRLERLGRRRPGEQTYRHSWFVENETRVTVAILGLIDVDVAVVCVVLALATGDGDPLSTRSVAWLAALAVGVPIGIAAVLGAQTLHRHGWFVGLFLSAGFVVGPVGMVSGDRALLVVGISLCVFGVVGFRVLG